MGQKIHPIGLRIGVIRAADSTWYADKKTYKANLSQDKKIRDTIRDRFGMGIISRVEIERAAIRIKINIYTSRPGAIIGKGGSGIDQLTQDLNDMVRKQDSSLVVQVNVTEVRQPELDAQLVAENIAIQLEKRVSHRRAMRQAMTRVTRLNGKGIKVLVSGRLNGSEIARSEGDKQGKVPLHTLRADIDYGVATAKTVYGCIGIKVWLYKGEVLPEKQRQQEAAARRRESEPQPIEASAAPAPKKEVEEVNANVDA
ncbi:MAG: 30S ribosomal protein S3 [Chthonomonas sp.]|nr:30S ribosomal protein S3 [Chthonomonas sp.]